VTIVAAISQAEVTAQVTERFVDKYIEALLINAPTITYTPGTTNDVNFLANEATEGVAGYERQVINYVGSDVGAYADEAVGMATKAVIFSHDASSTSINFTHAALVWGTGNITGIGAATTDPAVGTTGIYTNLPTSTQGSGRGATLDLVVSNNTYTFTLANAGRNYTTSDTLTVVTADLIAAGVLPSGSAEPSANLPIDSVSSNANSGTVIAVAETASAVTLSSGNQTAFYFTLQLFGVDGLG